MERRDETAHHHVVNLRLGLVQPAGPRAGRNDGEVVADLRVVEDALLLSHPAIADHPPGVLGIRRAAEGAQHLLHLLHVILRQRRGFRARIGCDLVLLVERLRDVQGLLRGELELLVGLTLQGGEIKQLGWCAGRGLRFIPDRTGRDAPALGYNRFRLRPVPESTASGCRILVAIGNLNGGRGTEPSADIGARLRPKGRMDFPVVLRNEGFDLLLTMHEDGERRRLHPTRRHHFVALGLPLAQPCHTTRAVDAYQPVRLTATLRGVAQRVELGA
ncbi:hypothetical protein SDC9_140441 [bioreactor metagenome]|uniref:Uncharacterized protein n=1 Tax=bioreactor metagenome TaxID=1076179 RepID=A0A645DVJ0_9ZZZZ